MAVTTNYTGISYIEEITEGVTPDTPAFQLLPTTGGSPVSSLTTAVSEVIRDDRQTDDLIIVDTEVGGDINYELSYAPYKPFMIALMQNDTIGSISFTDASFDAINFDVISGTGIDAAVSNGDVFKLTSATEPLIDGVYTCLDNSGPDQIIIYPEINSNAAAAADIVVSATEIITNGADEPKSYTFRKTAREGNTTYYWYYRGIKINTMNFNFATGSILNGSFNVMGLTEEPTETPITGETELPVPPYSIMNAVSSLGTIYIEGVAVGTCTFNSLDLTYDNQITPAKSIGVLGACATASFSVDITGNIEMYFQDLSMYHKFVNAQDFAVTLILTDGDGNSIGINMPKCKYETLDSPIDGKDQFFMQSGSFRALRDADENYMFKFCFIDAA